MKIFVDGTDSPGDWGIFQFPEDRRVPGFRETIRKNAGYTLPLGGANGGKVASGSCLVLIPQTSELRSSRGWSSNSSLGISGFSPTRSCARGGCPPGETGAPPAPHSLKRISGQDVKDRRSEKESGNLLPGGLPGNVYGSVCIDDWPSRPVLFPVIVSGAYVV